MARKTNANMTDSGSTKFIAKTTSNTTPSSDSLAGQLAKDRAAEANRRYGNASSDNSLAAQIYRDEQANANRNGQGATINADTSDYWSLENDRQRRIQRQYEQYNELRKEINEAKDCLENACAKILSGLEALKGFSGQNVDSIRNLLNKQLEEINKTGEALNAEYLNAVQKQKELGYNVSDIYIGKYKSVDIPKSTTNDSQYSCDIDTLLNIVIPALEVANNDINKAKDISLNFKDIGGQGSQRKSGF